MLWNLYSTCPSSDQLLILPKRGNRFELYLCFIFLVLFCLSPDHHLERFSENVKICFRSNSEICLKTKLQGAPEPVWPDWSIQHHLGDFSKIVFAIFDPNQTNFWVYFSSEGCLGNIWAVFLLIFATFSCNLQSGNPDPNIVNIRAETSKQIDITFVIESHAKSNRSGQLVNFFKP